MRVFLFINIFLIILILGCQDKNEFNSIAKKKNPDFQNNYKTLNIKGKVKNIKCIKYDQFIPNSELSNYVTKEDYIFDEKGNVTQKTVYLKDQKFHYRYVYKYDEMGNYIKFESYDKNNLLEFKVLKKFNKNGLLISEKELKPASTLHYEHNYYFDEISDTVLNYTSYQKVPPARDSTKHIKTFLNGNLTSRTSFRKGKILSKHTYQYDSLNNMTRELEFSLMDTINWRISIKNKYDLNKRRIYTYRELLDYNTAQETSYSYDKYGNLLTKKYSENGLIIQNKSFKNDYNYDEQGNWTKRTTLKLNGEPKFTLERRITYFDEKK